MNSESNSWLRLTASTSSSLNLTENEEDDEFEEKEDYEASKLQKRPISTGNSKRMEKLILKTNKQEIKRKSLNKTPIKHKKMSRNESGLESDDSINEDKFEYLFKKQSINKQNQNALKNLQEQIFQGKFY